MVINRTLSQLRKNALHVITDIRNDKKHQSRLVLAGLGGLIVVAAGLGVAVRSDRSDASVNRPSMEIAANLPFKALIPKNTTIDKLGGWRKVSPPDSAPVYAYTDKVAGVPVIVSQQVLPNSLNNDNRITELAKGFNATDRLNVKDVNVYIGTSAKGPQSVIFVKDSLLILIKSTDKIEDSDWIDYIQSLI